MTNINTIVVVDTETTDLDPKAGAELMELGFITLRYSPELEEWNWGHGKWHFIETSAKINPLARAVHHIRPEQCEEGAPNCFPRKMVVGAMVQAERSGMMYAAHNAPFDRAFLPELGAPWIDTLQCARHIYPDAPRHGNQVLRYWLEVEPPPSLLVDLEAHRALYDAACSAAILLQMLNGRTPEHLLELTNTPVLQKNCNFGKHRGQPWSEIPTDYMVWMRRSGDFYQSDPDLRYTIDHHLKLRAAS
jgi:DNA polymerase III, epsilon subunit and related 3''-5'' exonucleases